jgi:fermentation-respiration switch protein FrsA (DUF1100 family)
LGELACVLSSGGDSGGAWSCTRLAQDDILDKPPMSAAATVGFHQDGRYISDNFEPRENNS